MTKRFYRPDEVGELLVLARRTVYRMIKDGRLHGVRYGSGPWRIPKESLEALWPGGEMPPEKLLTPEAVAQQMEVTRSSVYRWFWEGKLQGIKLQMGPVRIYESAVRAAMNQMEGGVHG